MKLKSFVSEPSLKEKGDRLRWMSPRDSEIVRKPLATDESERLKNGIELFTTDETYFISD